MTRSEQMARVKINPNCSVRGCKATASHLQDKHVKVLMDSTTARPHVMAAYIADGLAQLGNSACNDLANHNALGFITRQRQIQELHVRGLYLLLIAEAAEQAHMLSGDMPNGLASYYRKVNELIFHKQIDWEAPTLVSMETPSQLWRRFTKARMCRSRL